MLQRAQGQQIGGWLCLPALVLHLLAPLGHGSSRFDADASDRLLTVSTQGGGVSDSLPVIQRIHAHDLAGRSVPSRKREMGSGCNQLTNGAECQTKCLSRDPIPKQLPEETDTTNT